MSRTTNSRQSPGMRESRINRRFSRNGVDVEARTGLNQHSITPFLPGRQETHEGAQRQLARGIILAHCPQFSPTSSVLRTKSSAAGCAVCSSQIWVGAFIPKEFDVCWWPSEGPFRIGGEEFTPKGFGFEDEESVGEGSDCVGVPGLSRSVDGCDQPYFRE
ncbi:hypothetical protein JTE90_007482 [Oedothorax gibbosus]|uniref:Uncharacterized protein n=1 Tax=Oedothorax gibbosus TaxID=931172 RepID=A0AAV6TCS0_9ARAC|nr:hypothetical protein JTE90_007482 [Oedothorax gibbosus]